MSASFRQWRRTIYALKRAYGQAVSVCRTNNDATDLVTGIQSNTETTVAVSRAVVLPAKSMRAFAYDLSFIAANKNFTYGGFFDHTARLVLISRRDIPSTFPIDNNDYLRFAGRRYQVKEVHEYEELEIVAFLVDGLSNANPLAQNNETITENFGLGQTGTGS